MTANEVANKLGITRSYVTILIRTGKLAATLCPGMNGKNGRYYVAPEATDEYLANRRKLTQFNDRTRILSTQQVAEELGLTHFYVSRLIKSGKLEGVRVDADIKGIGRYSITRQALDEYKKQLHLSIKQVAEKLGVNNYKVWDLIKSGELVGVKPQGAQRYRITEEAVEDYLAHRDEYLANRKRRRSVIISAGPKPNYDYGDATLSFLDVAKILNVAHAHVNLLICSGKLAAVRPKGARLYMISQAALDEYLAHYTMRNHYRRRNNST